MTSIQQRTRHGAGWSPARIRATRATGVGAIRTRLRALAARIGGIHWHISLPRADGNVGRRGS